VCHGSGGLRKLLWKMLMKVCSEEVSNQLLRLWLSALRPRDAFQLSQWGGNADP
jgi:hypothetical protein